MGASSSLVMTNGIGAIFGPVLAAGLFTFFGHRLYFVTLVATHGAIAAYLAFRIIFKDGVPLAKQGRFVPVPARASAAILIGRRRRR